MNRYSTNLGLVATHRRKIESGTEYNRYFPSPLGETIMVNPAATVFDTLDKVVSLVKQTKSETANISRILKKGTTRDTLKSVFDFTYSHIQYAKDKEGVEQLRKPARAWADRKEGIDCDCFSVFVGSILTNLKIPHYFRIIKRNGAADFSHIYVIVPKTKTSNLHVRSDYWVIDPVLDRFDKEADSITQKFDKMGNIPLEVLGGIIDQEPMVSGVFDRNKILYGTEYDQIAGMMGLGSLSGMGGLDAEAELAYKVKNKALKQHLINTRKNLMIQPGGKLYDKIKFDNALAYVISCWDNPVAREKALKAVTEREHQFINYKSIKVIHGIGGASGILGSVEVTDLLGEADDDHFDGLGKVKFFKKVAAAVKTTGAKMKETAKKVNKKVAQVAKKVVKAVVKLNPLSVSIRAGVLLAAVINFAGISKKLMYGYMTKEQALAKGVPLDNWEASRKALQQVEKIWKGPLGGDVNKLKNSILSGKRKNLLSGVSGLGVLPAVAALTPAMAFLAKIGGIIGKAFKGVKKVVDVVDKGKETVQEIKEAAGLNKFSQENPSAVNEFDENAVNTGSGDSTSPANYNSNASNDNTSFNPGTDQNTNSNSAADPGNNASAVNPEQKTSGGGGMGAIILGGLLIGALALSGGKKGKGMGEIEDDITENLSGAGKKKVKNKNKNKNTGSRKSNTRKKVYQSAF